MSTDRVALTLGAIAANRICLARGGRVDSLIRVAKDQVNVGAASRRSLS